MDLVILAVSFVIILVGAELFTNGIEWFGHKMNLAEGAVGSVLAAVGTALPETMIPIVAILFSSSGNQEASDAVGVGAILGAPFMLATLAMFVTGLAVLSQARRRPAGDVMPVDSDVLGKDIRYFSVAYGLAVAVAFVPSEFGWVKPAAAVLLLVIYALYVKAHFEADPNVDAVDLAPLRFNRLDRSREDGDPQGPRLRVVSLQVVAALALIIAGAVAFVGAVEHLAEVVGINPAILALVVAPIATELPEKFNSIIWVRQGKDTLAMGNITGAMVFQSCIPTVVALLFAGSSWAVTEDSLISFASAGIAFLSTAAIFLPMIRRGRLNGRGLLIGGLFYAIYLGLVVLSLTGVL
ncbi:MAG: sodium:calcium antiporter [Candidatus Limnocylindrales bacterium]